MLASQSCFMLSKNSFSDSAKMSLECSTVFTSFRSAGDFFIGIQSRAGITFLDLRSSDDANRNERVRRAMRTHGKQEATRKDRSLGGAGSSLASTGLSERSLSKRSAMAGTHDPLYLFACHLEWHHRRNLGGYQTLVAALDDSDKRIRAIAETMLHRCSPRP